MIVKASIILLLIASLAQTALADLGSQYCGIVEKKYGIVEGSDYDRVVGPKALVIRIEGTISSWTKSYVFRAIKEAENRNIPLIIEFKTPGGMGIVKDIMLDVSTSKIPVIGFVTNRGATSAGAVLFMSTHIAVMQPGAIIGASQPSPLISTSSNDTKIMNILIKKLCEHGATKGRNATALVRLVLHNDCYGAEEALRFNIIDMIAMDRRELISKINGSIVVLYGGERVKLELDGSYEFRAPTLIEKLLNILSEIPIPYILFFVGLISIVGGIIMRNATIISIGSLASFLSFLGYGVDSSTVILLLIIFGAIFVLLSLLKEFYSALIGLTMLTLGIALLLTSEIVTMSEILMFQDALSNFALGLGTGIIIALLVYKARSKEK